ncbi:Crp/Fnr family transcriptional regulator [Paucibacter sp. KCTC 42545]|uniref:Crp/Fnr family transcriptional regulator n=1 Tax=Paucibacter sp. KCTC 42545 TaxID=1768242 RepID=UPI001E36BAC7|nr:Crp/Fnr family transcriptional regulator [Paucibacter sp. KCTC 42545]
MTLTPIQEARLLAAYPAVAALPAAMREAVLRQDAQWVQPAPGTQVFNEGMACQGFPMLLSGEIRVARVAATGRSLELYRVLPGDLCVASTASLFGHHQLAAQGQCTEACELVLLSPSGFAAWAADAGFRNYVFGLFADRLTELMALTEAVAFQRLDQRLASTLLGHGAVLQITHQALADELGTVREIVTRLLKRFEREGWLSLGRERIELLNVAALRLFAAQTTP